MLLDSQILIWLVRGTHGNMGPQTEKLLRSKFEDCTVSVSSFLEIKLKQRRGGLKPIDVSKLERHIVEAGATILDIKSAHTQNLPSFTKTKQADPFDLLLVAQAISEHLPLVTCNETIIAMKLPGLAIIDGRN